MTQQPLSSLSFGHQQQMVSSIYDAALDEKKWKGVIKKFCDSYRAEQGIIRMFNNSLDDVERVYAYNKDPSWNKPYNDHYKTVDPWLEIFTKVDNPFLSCTHYLISDREYKSTEFYADYVSPQGFHYGMGGVVRVNESKKCYFAFHRNQKLSGFEENSLESLWDLMPHIRRSLSLGEKTRSIDFENNLLRDSLNQMNSPLLLVNRNGKVLYINTLAEQLIQQIDGISIKNGHIFIRSIDDNQHIKKLIHRATHKQDKSVSKQSGAMCYTDPVSDRTLSILVNPINQTVTNNDTAYDEYALLLLNTNNRQMFCSAELLAELYNLTTAEARLTEQLCQGLKLDQIARKLGLSKNTLRSQLRSTFLKTGVYRQAELIRLVNSGPAGMMNSD